MKKSDSKVLTFFKKNAAYLVLALCVLAVGLSTAIALISDANRKESVNNAPIPDDYVVSDDGVADAETPLPEKPDVSEPVVSVITFAMPVSNPVSIENYNETMAWNGTLNRYSTHKAIDFFAAEGTPVCAAYGGTVEEVTSDVLKGVTVVIDHGNGLKTKYNSLQDPDEVTVGKTVAKGDVIGHVSVTNRQEAGSGAHLHFEVIENGEVIDPVKYLTIDEK